MARLEKLKRNYMDEILYKIISNDNITKFIYYNVENPLNQSKLSNPSNLIYTKIFPHRFIPNISTDACTYLNIGFSEFKQVSNNSFYTAGNINFFAISHKTLWKTNYGNRCICILDELDSLLQNTRLGIGKLELTGFGEYWYNNDFGGYYTSYKVYDF